MPARRPRQTTARRARTSASDPAPVAPEAGDQQWPSDFRTQHDAFMTMVNAGMDEHNNKMSVRDAIDGWWNAIMMLPFPEEEHTAYELVLAMQYTAIMNSYERHGLNPPLKFAKNWKAAITYNYAELSPGMHSIVSAETHGRLGNIVIQPLQQGEDMAARRTSSAKSEAPASGGRAAKAGGAKKESDGRAPLSKFVMELIHGCELTDKEIVAKCEKAYPDRKVTGNIAELYRSEMNKGNKERSGYPVPKKPYAEIGGEAKPKAEPKGEADAKEDAPKASRRTRRGSAPTPDAAPAPRSARRRTRS
jgi:hypothetical protein